MLAVPSLRPFAHKLGWTKSGSTFFLLAISALAILGLVFLAAFWAGTESDAAALDRQRNLVNNRLRDQVERVLHEMQLMAAGYASLLMADLAGSNGGMSDAAEHSSATSAETFGKVATTVFGYNAVFLVTPEGKLSLQDDPETVRRFKWVRPLLEPMIRDLEAQQRQGAVQTGSAPELRKVGLMRLEGRPSVAGVIPVAGSFQADPAKRVYLVAFRFLDGTTLDTLSREQGLSGARYARTADQEKDEVAYQIEATSTGEPIGFIIWKPDLPGSRVIGSLVPVLSVAGLVIAGLFFALMDRLRRSLRDLRASELHARHLALHDVLTGLPNRALFAVRFEECLGAMKSNGGSAAIALVDLDKFKEVNDAYGHPAGDELLRGAVDRMSALLTSGHTLARIGGDEFALLFPGLRQGDRAHVALCNEIIETLGKPFRLRGGDAVVHIGCSAGVAAFHDAALASSELLRRADVALYEAKSNGRGRLIEYDPSLDHGVAAREMLKNDLRTVLDDCADHPDGDKHARTGAAGALEIFYQGVHRADRQGALSGAEALLRWRHPLHGLMSPDKFIPLAEEAGMMDQLGEWVLRNAVHAAAGWPDDISVAVNVSPSQIRVKGFEQHVLSILAETGLPPSRLELELTEAALFNVDENAQTMIGRLRSKGIRIALDDFGTGFSSLSHLLQLNIDRIKIDRTFVRLLGTQAEGAAIVSAVLNLSRTLGKATTAEGVETESQWDFLIAAGCTDIQGFLLSRPAPLSEFMASLPSSAAHSAARLAVQG